LGFSYGSFLGQTFASLQPHRVRRMVLDGVVDPSLYIRQDYSDKIKDVDRISIILTKSCHAAEPGQCMLCPDGGPAQIHKIINSTIQKISSRPLSGYADQGPTIVTYDDINSKMFYAYYSPFRDFKYVAQFPYDLSQGNITSLVSSPELINSSKSHRFAHEVYGAALGIMCSDGDNIIGTSQSLLRSYLSSTLNSSSLGGAQTPLRQSGCYNYTVRAKWRFEGLFGGKTAHPILFASQILDSVCPFSQATSAPKLFPGSVVIETNGVGHCTLAMPSICTANLIQRYFQSGALPANGTRCPIYLGPFGLVTRGSRGTGSDGKGLLSTLAEIGSTWMG
jgi:pimeloyl-ACP methyl ester carboxylesterase